MSKLRKIKYILILAVIFAITGCTKAQEEVYQIPEDKKLIVYTAHKKEV